MAVFSGKQILYAVFTNNANDTIEVVYNHKEDGEPTEYISVWVPATDPTNVELIGLKEAGWSFERIQRETHDRIDNLLKARQAELGRAIDAKVKEQVDHYYTIINEEANARVKIINEEVNAQANARVKAELDKYYEIINNENKMSWEEIDAKVKEQVDRYYEIINNETEMTREQIAAAYEQRYAEMISTGPAITTTVFQSVMDNNADEELLFKSKLAAFEIPQIKELKDRAAKQKIRTAKSLMELFGVLHSILQEAT